MSVSALLIGLFLVMYGVTSLHWVTISAEVLGLVAFIAGLAVLFEGAVVKLVKRD
jgi:hypothetical protein